MLDPCHTQGAPCERRSTAFVCAAVSFMLVAFTVSPASAASRSWIGDGSTPFFEDTGNWAGIDNHPRPGDQLVFTEQDPNVFFHFPNNTGTGGFADGISNNEH